MEDLLKSQIMNGCKLSMPEGLTELMSDIAREVLRAQPKDIFKFITNYLSCLLVTRENLSVAHRVYNNLCDHIHPERLEDELRKINVYSDDIEIIKQLLAKYFKEVSADKPVNEAMLLSKVLHRTSIVVDQIPDVQIAIRKAFRDHQEQDLLNVDKFTATDKCTDDVARAVDYTLKLYNKTEATNSEYNRAAARIQAAYRAYGVKREKANVEKVHWSYSPKIVIGPEAVETIELDKDTRLLSHQDEMRDSKSTISYETNRQKFMDFYSQSDDNSSSSIKSSANDLLPYTEVEKDNIVYDVPEEIPDEIEEIPEEIVTPEGEETIFKCEEDIQENISIENDSDDFNRDTNVKFDGMPEIIVLNEPDDSKLLEMLRVDEAN